MTQVNTMVGARRSFSSRFGSVFTVVAAFCAVPGFGSNALAESPIPHTAHTTMVVLSDRPIDDGQWAALVLQLHRGQSEVAAFIPVIGPDIDVDVLRGRDASPGLTALERISIFLKGDCTLLPRSHTFVQGALGWVNEARGRILPYVYVDCERIEEMLGPLALGMNRERRNTVMAEAIARVILHEWVHIETQRAGHGQSGVTQPEFKVRDLLANDEQMHPRKPTKRDRKLEVGF
jgi:hypothetical protein